MIDAAATPVRAVVDCGSNSTRLWLRPDADGAVERHEQVTRLGQGVDATRRLHPDAMERTFSVVDRYARRWREVGVSDDEVVVIATSAVRDADNTQDFRSRMVAVAGVEPRVLSGPQEAAASFVGATGDVVAGTACLVVDIGGGSTELVVGTAGDIEGLAAVSLQLGTVRLTERSLHDDPPSAEQVVDARHLAGSLIDGGLADVGLDPDAAAPNLHVVAVAGTATTLAALDLGTGDLEAIDRHRLNADSLAELTHDLIRRSVRDRLELGPLDEGRADVIAAGALILEEIVRRVGSDAVEISVADVMDGMAALA